MIGTTLQSRYRLDSELGRGGMGVVYRAQDTLLNRAVAVKVLSDSGLGTEGRARLLREAQAAAKLNHPNIVAVYDAGEADGSPYIVMELVEGESLFHRQPGSLDEILSIARQICAALEHAHTNDIVHRDLKPENILISKDGTAKLMDFGLARSVSSRLTSEGIIVGTVFYLAPEQAMGEPFDGRADLYSLGVMLYELTTERLPFTGDDPLAVISQHLHAPVVPPRTHREELYPALDALIIKLLAKNPEERYASAREVTQSLNEISELPYAAAALTEVAPAITLLEQLARGRLIARRTELNQLRDLWAHTMQGHGHLALISGEPGSGKTRLANEMTVLAQLNGAVILCGGCYEYEATTPYLPFVEALRDWVHAQDRESLRRQLGNTAAELVKFAPEVESKIGPLTPNPPLPPNEERLRLFDNAARFLQILAEKRGLLFFIDDLHWADQGTLSLLHYLLRHLRGDRVLFLAAYREVELDRIHPLAAALVEWNRDRLATRIQLGRLSREDTGALLAALFGQSNVSDEFAAAIYRETEGNPFFIEEVVKSLIEQEQIYRQDGRWGRKEIRELAIPQSIKEAIGRRLNRLSPACLEVLHTAGAIGKIFPFRELAAVAAASEDQLLDALDEGIAAQLIQPQSNEAFAFTHDKIREVIRDELNPIRHRRLHQRIGEALEKLYGVVAGAGVELLRQQDIEAHVQELAHHFTQSGDLQKSLFYSIRAAEKAERLFAHDEALKFLEHAREAAEALNQSEPLGTIYEMLGEIYSLRGPVSLAVENYERAIALAPTRGKRGALEAKIGRDYMQVGDARGLDFIQAALQDLDPQTQTNEIALATAMLGRYYHYRAQHSKAIEYLERARQLAEPLDDAFTVFTIYGYLAGAHQHLARYEQSMVWARRAIELGERKNFPLASATGNEFLAEDSCAMGSWQDAVTFAARDREIGEKIGAQDRVAWAGYCRAWALFYIGQLSAAAEAAQRSLPLAEGIGDLRLAIMESGLYAMILTDLGQDDEARAVGELAVARADELRHVVIQTLTRSSLAYFHVQRGEWERALDLCDQAIELIAPTENRWMRLVHGPIHAEAYYGAGRIEHAAKAIEENLTLAREAHSRHWEALARRVQGQIFAAKKLYADAARAFDEAIKTFDELGSRIELGRALYHRGQLHDQGGNSQAALADWARAWELFKAAGAQRDQMRLENAMPIEP